MERRRTIAAAVTAALVTTGAVAVGPALGQEDRCDPERAAMTFRQDYIDTERAGGEPIVESLPDGTVLWGSHAGTTHFYTPGATGGVGPFVENYEGQTYQYYRAPGSETWEFSPRTPVHEGAADGSGVHNSGFSDPEFAVDSAGNIFISEINLANIAFSKSTDGGRTWTLQNVHGLTMTDRQWMEADTEDLLWVVGNAFGGGSWPNEPASGRTGNVLYRSDDGGVTFSRGQSMGGQQFNDIQVDERDGRLFQLHKGTSGPLEVWYAANARTEIPGQDADVNGKEDGKDGVQFVASRVVEDSRRLSIMGGDLSLDRDGNVYAVWDESGRGELAAGVWYAYSTDRGATFSDPVRVSTADAGTSIWPWVSVGDPGKVAITWLQHHPEPGGPQDGQRPAPDDAIGPWHVMVAHTNSGLGCDGSARPGFVVQQATPDDAPPHRDTVCNSGTTCQATATDRRLGDYFSNTITADGRLLIAISDTRQGGAVALPLAIEQEDGPRFSKPLRGGDNGRRPHDLPPRDRGRGAGRALTACPAASTCPGIAVR